MKNYKKILPVFFILFSYNFAYLQAKQNYQDYKNSINFYFEDKSLVEIINDFADKKKVNIIFPQNPTNLETLKNQNINYKPKKKLINLNKAKKLLLMFLELSGFSLFKKEKKVYEIIATSQPDQTGISRQPLDLYVNLKPKNIPDSEQRVRYLYYFKNILVKDQKNSLTQIIKEMSSLGASNPIFLDSSNGLILVDKANVISSIITLLAKLDSTGFKESIKVVQLFNVPAKSVAEILETLKKSLGSQKTKDQSILNEFALDTKIVPNTIHNSLIIMGRNNATDRISKFIEDYIDVSTESGKSILHVYELQYLDAQKFAPILQKIVSNQISAQANQSVSHGPYKFFENVIIQAEDIITTDITKQDTTEKNLINDTKFKPKGIEGKSSIGGNRLIIAAVVDDWKYLKKFIETLDVREPQVLLECAIVDFDNENIKKIAASVRNPESFQWAQGVDFLASHISSPSKLLGPDPKSLAQDLLALVGSDSLASSIEPGSLLLSFNDPATVPNSPNQPPGGIFGLVQILDQFRSANIVSHPYVLTKNNTKTNLSQKEIRRARGDLVPGPNGSFIIPVENITSEIEINALPQIASSEKLKLMINLDIVEFIGITLNRLDRHMSTTITVEDNQILVIGGLHRTATQEIETITPLLGNIPLVGNLFKGKQQKIVKTNIVIFVKPIIIMPKQNCDKADIYTKNKLNDEMRYMDETIVSNSKDPVTYLFFREENQVIRSSDVKEFINQTDNLKAKSFSIIPTHKTCHDKKIDFSEFKDKLSKYSNPF